MAIDSRDKRMSMIGLAKPWVRLFKNPTGTIDAAARAMLLFLYSGIGAPAPAVGSPRIIYALSRTATRPLVLSKTGNGLTGRSSE